MVLTALLRQPHKVQTAKCRRTSCTTAHVPLPMKALAAAMVAGGQSVQPSLSYYASVAPTQENQIKRAPPRKNTATQKIKWANVHVLLMAPKPLKEILQRSCHPKLLEWCTNTFFALFIRWINRHDSSDPTPFLYNLLWWSSSTAIFEVTLLL